MPEILGTLKPPRLATAPGSPALGQIFYDTAASALKTWNGSAWVPASVPADTVVTAATRILSSKLLSADANPAFRIMGDGKHEWGAGGSNPLDVNLYRYAADVLRTDDALYFNGGHIYGHTVQDTGSLWLRGDGYIYFGAADDVYLARSGAAALSTNGAFSVVGQTNLQGTVIFPGSYEMYKSNARWFVGTDGTLQWGPGDWSRDTNLYRWGADFLKTDDNFQAALSIYADNGIYAKAQMVAYNTDSFWQTTIGWVTGAPGPGIWLSAANDTGLYRYAAGYLATDGQLYFRGGTNAYLAFARPGEQARFFIGPDGNMNWGSGAGAQDVNLYRSAADVLKTDDTFHINTPGVLALNSGGGGGTPQTVSEIAYYGSSRQYRHHIKSHHDASVAVNNYLDFHIWTPTDTPDTLGTKRALRLRGDGAIVFADGTAQSTAAAGGAVYIGSTVLAARALQMVYDPFPTTYRTIVVYIFGWIAPSTNGDTTTLTWKPRPDPGNMHIALTGNGSPAPVMSPGQNPVPLQTVVYHSIYQNSAQLHAEITFMPGWNDATKRHGIRHVSTAIIGVAGTNADVGLLQGMILSPGSGGSQTLKAITGIQVDATRNFEIGSRIDVFGYM